MYEKGTAKPIGGESTPQYNKNITWTKAFWSMDSKLWPPED